MANTKVQWSGKINIGKKKKVKRERKLISASTGCSKAYPYMASQEVVLWLRARGQKQNGALASKFWRLLSLLGKADRKFRGTDQFSVLWYLRIFGPSIRRIWTNTVNVDSPFSEAYGQANSQQTCIAHYTTCSTEQLVYKLNFSNVALFTGLKKMRMKGKMGFFILNDLSHKVVLG